MQQTSLLSCDSTILRHGLDSTGMVCELWPLKDARPSTGLALAVLNLQGRCSLLELRCGRLRLVGDIPVEIAGL